MPDPHPIQAERPVFQRLGKAFAFFLLAVLLIVGGWKGFSVAKLHLALSNAHREFSHRQFMRAEFWTDRALTVDKANVEALRLMALINEAQDKPAALGWRLKVAQRESGNADDLMAWAKSAVRFGQIEMAVRALKNLPQDFKNRSAEYHELMAGCALAGHETGLAEAFFVRAAEIDRDNPVHRMNLAAFRLTNSPSREARAVAARDLEGMLADSRVSLFAARTLLADAIRNKDRARVQRFAKKLRSLPEHVFSDDLSCLEASMPEPDFHSALEEIEHRAGTDLLWAIEMGSWLNSRGMPAETLRWSAQLRGTMRSEVRVQMIAAESYLALSDWKELKVFLAKANWGDCEFLRRSMLIRCQRELSQPWEEEWKRLLTQVEANPHDALLLAQLVVGWKWRNETLDLLWGAAAKPVTKSQALQLLWALYSETKETGALLRVAKARLDFDPSNPANKNNVAFLSLLLDGVSPHSERLAQEAAAANPSVPEWTVTYAYALHLAGKEAEAKTVLKSPSSEALRRPGVALYHAIVLAANRDYAGAREVLGKLNSKGMLPEEQQLVADLAQQLKAQPVNVEVR